ncbi:hypothetical protein ACOI22_05310 [Glaciecola sp. 2405UD65-10]|uniref:hypothetical protein n=1 Tax=Glaciecola sp. 2405UD65-10 TaxID=3397244 RepID=UPI003B59206D
MTVSNRFLVVYILLISLSFLANASEDENAGSQIKRYENGDELLFEVLIDKYRLGYIVGRVNNQEMVLDFENYLEIMEFPIQKSADNKYKGWYFNQQNTFEFSPLEASAGGVKIKLKDQNISLDQNSYLFADDILYINEKKLTKTFGISHTFDYEKLSIRLNSKEKFPFIERLERMNKRLGKSNGNDVKYVRLKRGYGILSPQILDMQFGIAHTESTDRTSANYSILGTRDLALIGTEFYLAGNDDDLLSSARVKLKKQSSKGDLLGILQATNFEVGDVRPVRTGNSSSNGESRGFRVSNATSLNQINNQLVNIQGPVQVGWDAELYRNGLLLDQQLNIQTGRYEFLDVSLIFGLNEFEITLYGPQGQVEVRQYNKLIDKTLMDDKRFVYDVSINESNRSVLGVNDSEDNFSSDYNLSSQFRYKYSSATQISGGFQQIFNNDTSNASTYNLGLTSYVSDNVLADLTYTGNSASDSISAGLRTSLLGQSLNLRLSNTEPKDDSEYYFRSLDLTTSGHVRIGVFNFPIQNSLRLQDTAGSERLEASNNIGFSMNGLYLYNRISFIQDTFLTGDKNTQTVGSLTMQKGFGTLFARLGLNYDLENDTAFDSYNASLNWNISQSWKARLDYSGTIDADNEKVGFQLGWTNQKVNINSNFTWSEAAGWTAGLQARIALTGTDSRYRDIYSERTGLTGRGSVAVRVFLDQNYNALYDIGEPVIEDVTVLAPQVIRKISTSSTGIALIANISDQKQSDISVDIDTLPDQFFKPLVDGVSIEFREGYTDNLDFPIVLTSELEGQIDLVSEDLLEPGRNLLVNLVDSKGRIAKQTLSEFDGFYIFDGVIPGNYKVEIDTSSLNKVDAINYPVSAIRVDKHSEIYLIDDLRVRKRMYLKGFAVKLGNFVNQKILNIYASRLHKQLNIPRGQLQKRLENDGSYSLLSGFYPQEVSAALDCLEITQHGIFCEAIPALVSEQ